MSEIKPFLLRPNKKEINLWKLEAKARLQSTNKFILKVVRDEIVKSKKRKK